MTEPSPQTTESAWAGRALDEAREGSAEAIGRLLETFRSYLLLVANQELDSRIQSKEGASDLVQETFLKAFREFGQFEGATPEELAGWLRRILLNHLTDRARRFAAGKRRADLERPLDGDSRHDYRETVEAPAPAPDRRLIQTEESQRLHRALERLPDHYVQVILLRNRDLLPFEEIGQKLGRSAEAVRKLWGRAVELLHQELEDSDAK